MITRVSVCLEVGPEATAVFAPGYPGCWVYGQDEKEALQAITTNIIEWPSWMKRHGETVPDISETVKLEVVEMLQVEYDPSEAGTPEPLFWVDVAPITREDIERTTRWMGYSRNDLITLISSISANHLDWQPAVKLRPIRNCLIHIATAELWYINRLNIEVPEKEKLPASPTELLNYSRGIVTGHLLNLPKKKMKGVFQPRKFQSPVCNLWTARKVLRRIIDHEMLHIRDIKRVLELAKGTR